MLVNQLNSIFRTKWNILASIYQTQMRPLSSNEIKTENLQLTEDLPPVPPSYGWPGDQSIKNYFEIKKIKESFKYGNPPRMKRKALKGPQVIRLFPITHCSNRPFYRLALTYNNYGPEDGFIEDLGSIDPMPNRDNQILVALNIERIKYHISRSVAVKGNVAPILGLAGLLPVHPNSHLRAFRNRRIISKNEAEKESQKESLTN